MPATPVKGDPAVAAEQSILLSSIQSALQYAMQEGHWVVVVAPSGKPVEAARRTLTSILPTGTTGGGRTFLLPGKGRISVADAAEKVFVPEGTEFTAMFVTWSVAETSSLQGMSRWRSASKRVIDMLHTRDLTTA